MRWLHVVVGIVGVVGFLATGQYMDRAHGHLRGMEDAQRLLFRSTHLYLLFASLLNLVLGLHLKPGVGWRWWVQAVGSGCLLAAPLLATAGFFTEPWLSGLQRPYSAPATSLCLAGVLVHGVARVVSPGTNVGAVRRQRHNEPVTVNDVSRVRADGGTDLPDPQHNTTEVSRCTDSH